VRNTLLALTLMLAFLSTLINASSTEDWLQKTLRNDSLVVNKQHIHSKNPLEWILNFYQKFISTQDGDNCSFYPSCSEYAKSAFHVKGLFKGTLMTADRLTRCYGLRPDIYETDLKTGLNLDTLSTHHNK
jgi:putative component of membrane protein insertase Oxa1/YidC/SpoIIIJ protein YidD